MNKLALVVALSAAFSSAACTQPVGSGDELPPGAVAHTSQEIVTTYYNICSSAEACADENKDWDGCYCKDRTDNCRIETDGLGADPNDASAMGTLTWSSTTVWDAHRYAYRLTGTNYTWGQYSVSVAVNSLGCEHVAKGNKVITKRLPGGAITRTHYGIRYNPGSRTFASNTAYSPYATLTSNTTTYFTSRLSTTNSSYFSVAMLVAF